MKKLFFISILFILLASFVSAQTLTAATDPNKVYILFFYGKGCPHCAKAEPFLENLAERYPQVELLTYEIWYDSENAKLFSDLSTACHKKVMGVPTFFIGEEVIVGYDNEFSKGREIESTVQKCIKEGCINTLDKLKEHDATCTIDHETEKDYIVNLPLIGKIDTRNMSLPLFTFIIGLLDGFNPCAIWVLCFLLTLLIYAKSRKKMLLIGSIFVFASGFVYFLFMTAWLNFFLFMGYVNALRMVIAIIAIITGLINIKDFFWFKKGVSLTIPDRLKPKLFKKMRKLVHESGLWGMILGTVVLAFTANTYELLCTAGFPAIYTRILTLKALPTFSYYAYLVLYNVVYVIPLAVVVAVFVKTMGAHRFTEKHGRILKIIAGLLMLALGLIMLLKPELLMFG